LQIIKKKLNAKRFFPLYQRREDDKLLEGYTLEDLRHMVSLGPLALPSICCYTFHNAQDSLSSVSLSHDATWMASGYNDSALQIHNLKGETIQTLKNGTELNMTSFPMGSTVSNYQIDTSKTSLKMVLNSEKDSVNLQLHIVWTQRARVLDIIQPRQQLFAEFFG